MHIILLSGGSGQRLWPLSNGERAKQFLKLFRGQDGQFCSMVQRIHHSLSTLVPEARLTVAISEAQLPAIREQLGDDVGTSIEPCRRDTFPAIALATAYLRDKLGAADDEMVVVCPVDPWVDATYFLALKELAARVADHPDINLALLGMTPTYPSAKYGYIIPHTADAFTRVAHFREKPNEDIAAQYIAQGGLWNGGVFAFRLAYLTERTQQLTGYTSHQDLLANYATLPRISFDYAVVEKEQHTAVLRFSGLWKDLGTWNTLTEVMTQNTIGPVETDSECRNLHVVNETHVPVLCMGLENIAVAVTPSGIIITDKERSSHIKPYVEIIQKKYQ